MNQNMNIGLLRGTVNLEEHNPNWENIANKTIKELNVLLCDIFVNIQHVGSTSIKGILAKPIIDLVIGVDNFEDILNMNEKLETHGYLFRGQDHPGQYLYVCGKDDFITHHIHVVKYNSIDWHNYLNFRDYLNANPDIAKQYSLLKVKLENLYPNERKLYTTNKSEFINDILIKASFWKNKLQSF